MSASHTLADILAIIDRAAGQLPPILADTARLEAWQARLSAGIAILDEGEFPEEDAARLLAATVAGQGQAPPDLPAARRLVAAFLESRTDDAFWQASGIGPERGNMYILLATQGALARLAKEIAASISLDDWSHSGCPICGSEPKFASLEEGSGARRLICGSCFASWRYRRIGCAACGEERPDRLRILTTDEFPAWSTAVCLTCRSYIKTADLRQLACTPAWQEAILATMPLDYAAVKWLHDTGTGHNQ